MECSQNGQHYGHIVMTDDPHTIRQFLMLGKYDCVDDARTAVLQCVYRLSADWRAEGQCQCYCCWGPPWLSCRTPSGRDWLYPTEHHWLSMRTAPPHTQGVSALSSLHFHPLPASVKGWLRRRNCIVTAPTLLETNGPTCERCSLIKRSKSDKFLFLLSGSFLRNVKWSVTN